MAYPIGEDGPWVNAEKIIPRLRDLACLLLGGWGFQWALRNGAAWPAIVGSMALLAGPSVLYVLFGAHTPERGQSLPSVPTPPSLPGASSSSPESPGPGGS